MLEHVVKLSPMRIRTERIQPIFRRKKDRFGPSPLNGCAGFMLVPQYQQRSVVKVSYVKNTPTRSWAAHGDYLQREHAQTPGERGVGFNTENESIDIKSLLKSWQKSCDELFFKVIVSPENGYRMNLLEHARDLVKQMEIDLDTHLEWAVIQHNNTDYPHLHIVIRGVDDHGKSLRIPKSYIRSDIRSNSQLLATKELGYMRQHDIIQQREQHIERNCATEIDRSLRHRADEDGIVSFKDRVPDNAIAREWRLQEIGRLKYLETLGLATHIDPKVWQLSDNTEAKLSELQQSDEIANAFEIHGIHINSSEELAPTEIVEDSPLTGQVVGMGLSQELYDKRYIIIEGTDGKAHYLNASNNLIKQHDQGEYHNGDIVTISRVSYSSGDEQFSTLTLTNHGPISELKIALSSKLDGDVIDFVKTTGQPPILSIHPEKSFAQEYADAMRERFEELKDDAKLFDHDKTDNHYELKPDWENRYNNWSALENFRQKCEIAWERDNGLEKPDEIFDAFERCGTPISSTAEITPTELDKDEALTGRIVSLGTLNEERYMVIEGTDGNAHYINATNNLVKQHYEKEYSTGDIVTLSCRPYVNKDDNWDTYLSIKNHGNMSDLKLAYYSKLDMDTIKSVEETGQPPTTIHSEQSFGHEYRDAMRECFQELKDAEVFYHDLSQDKFFLTHNWEQCYSNWIDTRKELAQQQEQSISMDQQPARTLNDDSRDIENKEDRELTKTAEIKRDDQLEHVRESKIEISF